jgi:hypothetical protein
MTVWLAPGKLKTAGLKGVHGLIDEPADAVVVEPAPGKSQAALPSSSIWRVPRCGAARFVTVMASQCSPSPGRSQPVTNSFHVTRLLRSALAGRRPVAAVRQRLLRWQPREPPLIVVDDDFVLDRWRPADGPALRRFDLDPDTARFFGYSVEQAAAMPASHYDGDARARGSLQSSPGPLGLSRRPAHSAAGRHQPGHAAHRDAGTLRA